jgi:hypothetical protein
VAIERRALPAVNEEAAWRRRLPALDEVTSLTLATDGKKPLYINNLQIVAVGWCRT